MTLLGVVAAAGVLGLFLGLGMLAAVLFQGLGAGSSRAESAQVRQLGIEVEHLKIAVAGLPSLWKNEADRAELALTHAKKENSRARAARSDAAKLLEAAQGDADEDGEPEDDDDELREGDARGEPVQGVLPLRAPMARDPEKDLSERALAVGWTPFL